MSSTSSTPGEEKPAQGSPLPEPAPADTPPPAKTPPLEELEKESKRASENGKDAPQKVL
jgi:hypothetical protein